MKSAKARELQKKLKKIQERYVWAINYESYLYFSKCLIEDIIKECEKSKDYFWVDAWKIDLKSVRSDMKKAGMLKDNL